MMIKSDQIIKYITSSYRIHRNQWMNYIEEGEKNVSKSANYEYVYKIVGRGCDCYLVLGDEETIMIDSECDKSRSSIYITNRET